jgi:acetyl-CoA C-acetyltransferase
MDVFVTETLRTPRGKAKADGALHPIRPVALAGQLFREMERRTGIDSRNVDEGFFGCVTQTGEQGGNIGQTAALYAGWTIDGPVTTVNSFCTSGLTASTLAASKLAAGLGGVMAVGGVECMSRVPMMSDNGPIAADKDVAAKLPFIPNPIVADYIAGVEGFTRDMLDGYAANSHRKAAAATAEGRFARSMVAARTEDGEVALASDELIRANASAAGMAKLNPLVSEDAAKAVGGKLIAKFGGTDAVRPLHHAGCAPGMVDGASLALLATRDGARKNDLPLRARIRTAAVANGPVALALTGGIEAAKRALKQAGMSGGDIDLWEFNEGFAALAMRFARELKVPDDRFNVNGGGIAMGHAMGATGINLIGIMLDELERRDLSTGLIAISGAAGIGGALILERL